MSTFSANFVRVVDSAIWFANAAAFNNWAAGITIAVPEASASTYGLVKQAIEPSFTYDLPGYGTFSAEHSVSPTNYYASLSYEDVLGVVTNYEFPTAAAFRQLAHNVEQIRQYLELWKNVVQNAGQMTGV